MLNWRDQALILSGRRFGENGLILDILTAHQGRRRGLVHGGASRRRRADFEAGNALTVTWTARLEEQLGRFELAELTQARAATYLDQPAALNALLTVCAVLRDVLDEGDKAGSALYRPTSLLLDGLENWTLWPALYARWELGLLSALGFGLDLSCCALSGATDGLSHVSPKTGRAVRADEAGAYIDRLFRLPAFLTDTGADATQADIQDALHLTGYFVEKRLFHAFNRRLPPTRARLIRFFRP